MEAGIFHWIINSEMLFYHNVILLYCWIYHLSGDIKSLCNSLPLETFEDLKDDFWEENH